MTKRGASGMSMWNGARRFRVFVASLCILAMSMIPISAKADDKLRFKTGWMIGPGTAPTDVQTVEPGEILLQQRVMPLSIAVLSKDFVDAGLQVDIKAGAQLVSAQSDNYRIFCSVEPFKAKNRRDSVGHTLHSGWHHCFVDQDGDLVFDRVFEGWNVVAALPSPGGQFQEKTAARISVPYTLGGSSDFQRQYFVGVRYEGQAKIGSLRRFCLVYGTEKAAECLTSENIFTKRDSDLPQSISVLGSSILIVRGEGNRLEYKVERPMSPQPFGVIIRTMQY